MGGRLGLARGEDRHLAHRKALAELEDGRLGDQVGGPRPVAVRGCWKKRNPFENPLVSWTARFPVWLQGIVPCGKRSMERRAFFFAPTMQGL